MDEKIKQLNEMVRECNHIVFFGGAGVSTESGIPDFRSVDGLYHQKYDYPPETILSHTFFMRKPEEFYRFYREKLLVTGIEPNAAHKKLAELEKIGKLDAVVTQNIDGLHQAAGSQKVYELHGSVLRNYCMDCHKFYRAEDLCEDEGGETSEKRMAKALVPRCTCGGMIKPDVVLYEEGLDEETLSGAIQAIARADMLIIGGTSLAVYPAAGLIDYFRGKYLVLVNRSATERDTNADLVIRDSIGEVFSQIQVDEI